MKVLITGGCGFIGSNLSIFLKKKGFQVESLDNLFRAGSILAEKKLKNYNIKNYRINIEDFNKVKNLKRYDLIIDCCAEPSVEASRDNLDRVFKTNLIGTFNVLKKSIIDKSYLVFLSTSRVYSLNNINRLIKNKNLKKDLKLKKEIAVGFSTESPKSIYGFTKLASEDLIKEFSFLFKLKFLINRLGVVAGPGQMGKVDQGFFSLWIWKHINKASLKYIGFGGHGNQVRDVLHIDDLCNIIFMQIKKIKNINNLTFSIGGGRKNLVSLKQLTKICEQISGNKCNIIKCKHTSDYDIPYFCTSNSFLKKIYKWQPKKNIYTIAKDIYEWQINEYHKLKKYLN